MRTFMMGTMAALALATLAGTVSADDRAPTRPHIELAPPVRITGFTRSSYQPGAYTGGPLDLAVDVENNGNTASEKIWVKLMIGDETRITVASIPAHGKSVILFTDNAGLASSCSPKKYKMTLSGTGVNTTVREGQVTPSCTFQSTLEETWNKMSPDVVEANKKGNAYLTSPSIVSAPTCAKGPTLKVRIVNHSAQSSASLVVQAKEWTSEAKVTAQTSAAFPLAVNESKELVLSPVNTGEMPAKTSLAITDWSKSLGGHTSSGGIFVNTTRSCTLAVALD